MITEALKYIAGLAEVKLIETDKGLFSNKQLHPVKKNWAVPPTIGSQTLQSVVDYVQAEIDEEKEYLVQIADANCVNLYGALNDEMGSRKSYISVSLPYNPFVFGANYETENFVISLMTLFDKTDTREELIKMVSSIKKEESVKVSDDGISQTVVAKQGIVRVGEVDLPNPIKLTPKRTFAEVDQIESEFVLRAKDCGGVITFSLHDCDGGAWKLGAIQNIFGFLFEKLKDEEKKITIIA